MRKILGICVLTLSLASGAAMAYGCEGTMNAIDQALASNPDLSEEKLAMVKALRKEGEEWHEQGNHGKSMSRLNRAASILDIR